MPAKFFWEVEMKDKKANQQMLLPHLKSLGLSCIAGPGSGSRTAHSGLKWVCILLPWCKEDTRASCSSITYSSTCEPQIHTVPRQEENELPKSKKQLLFPCASLQACIVKYFKAKVGRRWHPFNIEINTWTMMLGNFYMAHGIHRSQIQWLTQFMNGKTEVLARNSGSLCRKP